MKFVVRSLIHDSRRLGMALLMLLCSAISLSAWADPPGRVGRLGEMTGQVWLYSPDAGEWVAAVRNRPLTTGDRLSTEASARAEVRIGSSTVRLDSGTELEVMRIDDDKISLQLHSGSISARLRTAEAAREFELTTGEGRFVTHRPGRYRIDRKDEASHLTVWNGEALYEGPGSALTVYTGQRAEFWVDGNNAAQYTITDPVSDSFAAWSGDRDRQDERSASARYVSPEMTGVEDLDRYGHWQQAPEYGAVWVPSGVPSGWAPYGAGHWAWVSPWGWTWVDDQPWGFAPFHYGRWAMFNNNWCWVPGTYVRRPVYAPALVGWIGGPHVSLSISIGNQAPPSVGWFPLAPREVYVPTYRVSPHYVQQVNITHVTNITNVTTIINNPQQAVSQIDYRNRRFPHAVTVVPQATMTNHQPVAPIAAQWRNSAVTQQLINQPGQKVMLSAPPVAAPTPSPAVLETRRRIQAEAAARPAGTTPPPAAQAIPAPPSRQGSPAVRGVTEDQRAKASTADERRRDMREPGRSVPPTAAMAGGGSTATGAPGVPPTVRLQPPPASRQTPPAAAVNAAPPPAPTSPAVPQQPKPPVVVAPPAPPQPARTVPLPPHLQQQQQSQPQQHEEARRAMPRPPGAQHPVPPAPAAAPAPAPAPRPPAGPPPQAARPEAHVPVPPEHVRGGGHPPQREERQPGEERRGGEPRQQRQ